MRILWNGIYLDAQLTIGTTDSDAMHLKYAMRNEYCTLVGEVVFSTEQGKPMPDVTIRMNMAISNISKMYLQQEMNRKGEMLSNGTACLH